MADLERPEQELTPGYYDNQFGNRVGKITKPGFEPPTPSGGTWGGGGCLKGGGGIVFGLVLVVRLFLSHGCRDSSTPRYYAPSYSPSTSPNMPLPDQGFNRNKTEDDRKEENDRNLNELLKRIQEREAANSKPKAEVTKPRPAPEDDP